MKLQKIIESMIKDPEGTPDKVLILDITEEKLAGLFTPNRLKLIRILKENNIKSVGELAKKLDRPVESVSKDLKALQTYGILELIQNGKQKTPTLEKPTIIYTV